MGKTGTQRDQAIDLLQAKGIARLTEFRDAGITAATVGRMVRAGDVNRLARGLYQLPGACHYRTVDAEIIGQFRGAFRRFSSVGVRQWLA